MPSSIVPENILLLYNLTMKQGFANYYLRRYPDMPSTPPLQEQTVLITGAAQGLGRALVKAFSAASSRILAVDAAAQPLAALQQEFPAISAYQVDLCQRDQIAEFIQSALQHFGYVHTLIHNAGYLRPKPYLECSEEEWDRTFEVGIQAAHRLTRPLWPLWLKQGGCGIYVSSRSGVEGFGNEVPYCATKHAIEGFMKSLALEAEGTGIRLHTITPGMYLRTPMSEQNYTEELKSKWVDPIELTPAFLRLAQGTHPELHGQRLSAWELSEEIRAEK